MTTALKSSEAQFQQLNEELLRVQDSCDKQRLGICKDLKATQVKLVHQEESQAHLEVRVDRLNEKLNTLGFDCISVQDDMKGE